MKSIWYQIISESRDLKNWKAHLNPVKKWHSLEFFVWTVWFAWIEIHVHSLFTVRFEECSNFTKRSHTRQIDGKCAQHILCAKMYFLQINAMQWAVLKFEQYLSRNLIFVLNNLRIYNLTLNSDERNSNIQNSIPKLQFNEQLPIMHSKSLMTEEMSHSMCDNGKALKKPIFADLVNLKFRFWIFIDLAQFFRFTSIIEIIKKHTIQSERDQIQVVYCF